MAARTESQSEEVALPTTYLTHENPNSCRSRRWPPKYAAALYFQPHHESWPERCRGAQHYIGRGLRHPQGGAWGAGHRSISGAGDGYRLGSGPLSVAARSRSFRADSSVAYY